MAKEYIGRDEMIEQAKARIVFGAPKFNTGLKAAIEVATSIPAADVVERPRWIPVTERLPKQDDELDAICWISDGPGTEGYCITAFYNRSEQKWVPDAEWVDPNKVTHWMRRPEPPKEG